MLTSIGSPKLKLENLKNGKAPGEEWICLEMLGKLSHPRSSVRFCSRYRTLKTPQRDGKLALLSSFQRKAIVGTAIPGGEEG